MRFLRFILCSSLLLFPYAVWASCTGGSPSWTSTPDYTSVNACVGSATANDTITISSGTATWASTLTLTKGVAFVGAGIGSDNAITNMTIAYTPANPSTDVLKMTSFNLVNPYIVITNQSTTFTIFILGESVINATRVPLETNGQIKGAVYSNTMTGTPHIDNYGSAGWTWANLSPSGNTFAHGSADCLYYEDNTITTDETAFSGGHGGRYCARYNTYKWNRSYQNYTPWFDCHGNQPSSYGTMGVEIYGNLVDGYSRGGDIADLRGGHSVVFYNAAINSDPTGWDVKFREEYIDGDYPEANSYLMHITETRSWNNRAASDMSLSGSLLRGYTAESVGLTPIINSDFWYDARARFDKPYGEQIQAAGTFDGSVGVGCGTLASMPATCTTGVGYWATTQSCSDLTGMVGASPATPISGTLYKCAATDTWTAYYTPYTYPHPLRSTAVSAITGIAILPGVTVR